jgi:hypothetical protein
VGTVIHHDDFEIGIILIKETFEALAADCNLVQAHHHYGYKGIGAQ